MANMFLMALRLKLGKLGMVPVLGSIRAPVLEPASRVMLGLPSLKVMVELKGLGSGFDADRKMKAGVVRVLLEVDVGFPDITWVEAEEDG